MLEFCFPAALPPASVVAVKPTTEQEPVLTLVSEVESTLAFVLEQEPAPAAASSFNAISRLEPSQYQF